MRRMAFGPALAIRIEQMPFRHVNETLKSFGYGGGRTRSPERVPMATLVTQPKDLGQGTGFAFASVVSAYFESFHFHFVSFQFASFHATQVKQLRATGVARKFSLEWESHFVRKWDFKILRFLVPKVLRLW